MRSRFEGEKNGEENQFKKNFKDARGKSSGFFCHSSVGPHVSVTSQSGLEQSHQKQPNGDFFFPYPSSAYNLHINDSNRKTLVHTFPLSSIISPTVPAHGRALHLSPLPIISMDGESQ